MPEENPGKHNHNDNGQRQRLLPYSDRDILVQDHGPGHRRERIVLYDHEDPFREHLTPDVKHNIVKYDHKVNYDQWPFCH